MSGTNQFGPWYGTPGTGGSGLVNNPNQPNVAQTLPTPPGSDPSGELNTQLYLATVIGVQSPQQGVAAINAPVLNADGNGGAFWRWE